MFDLFACYALYIKYYAVWSIIVHKMSIVILPLVMRVTCARIEAV